MSRLINEAAALPPFTDDPVDRLRHTLAAYHDCQQDRRILTATQNALGSGVWTGLTIGDLQALVAEVERLRAERDRTVEYCRDIAASASRLGAPTFTAGARIVAMAAMKSLGVDPLAVTT